MEQSHIEGASPPFSSDCIRYNPLIQGKKMMNAVSISTIPILDCEWLSEIHLQLPFDLVLSEV